LTSLTFLLVIWSGNRRRFWSAVKSADVAASRSASRHLGRTSHCADAMQQVDHVISKHHIRPNVTKPITKWEFSSGLTAN